MIIIKARYYPRKTAGLLLFLLFVVVFNIMFYGLNCIAAPSEIGAWELKEKDVYLINGYERGGNESHLPEGSILDTSFAEETGGIVRLGSRETSTTKFVDNQIICEGHWLAYRRPGIHPEEIVFEYDALLSIMVSEPPARIVPGDLVELNASGYVQQQNIYNPDGYDPFIPDGSAYVYVQYGDETGFGRIEYPFKENKLEHNGDWTFVSLSVPENKGTYSWNVFELEDSNREFNIYVECTVTPGDPYAVVTKKYHYAWNGKAVSAVPAPSNPVRQTDDSGPKTSAGEETTDVKTAAILGIAATVAAIAGAGAATAGGTAGAAGTADQKVTEEAARQKTGDFRMVLFKSFGDTIFHGKTNQYIMARIERKNEGTGLWELDSARSDAISITISPVDGLGLYPPPSNTAVQGKGNTIMLQNEKPKATEATLFLKFLAPDGGYFQRNMKFKLSGEPTIKLAANKVWFLEGDYEPFELECQLIGYDPLEHNILLEGDKNYVTLKMAKNSKGDDVIKVTLVPDVFNNWDKKSFIYTYGCSIAYENKVNSRKIAKEEFTVNLCYEGIGLANSGPNKTTKIDELSEPMELFVYSDEESYRRTETMIRLALVVASWYDKKRMLEYDTETAKTLQLVYTVDTSSDQFKNDASKVSAVSALKDAALKTEQTDSAAGKLDYNKEMKPAFFATITTNVTESGLAPFPILLTIPLPGGKYPDLVIKGTFNPLCDWEKIVRWFFEFPTGTFAAGHMTVGNPDLYVEGLKFIENRVYSFKNVPFAPITNENHYEDGVIAATTHKRLRSVVLQESSIPTGIGDYKKVQSLVHELTHALEHKNMGSAWTLVAGKAGHERHSYFLQYASDAIYELALAERGVDTEGNVKTAIASMNKVYFNPDNTTEPRELSWFGAKVPTQHQLFKAYIDEWMSMGTIGGAGKVGEILSRTYFPGAIENTNKKLPAVFEVQSGKLKGAKFIITWKEGRILNFGIRHKHYQFDVKNPLRWTGGFTLSTKLEVIDKLTLDGMGTGTAQRGRDTFTVTLTASETLDYSNPNFMKITKFNAIWRLEYDRDDKNSVLAPDISNGKMITPLIKVENTDLRI